MENYFGVDASLPDVTYCHPALMEGGFCNGEAMDYLVIRLGTSFHYKIIFFSHAATDLENYFGWETARIRLK